MAPIRKLSAARKPDINPLGAVAVRNLSQARQTRYEEELAAMAGRSHVSSEKIIHPPLCHGYPQESDRALNTKNAVNSRRLTMVFLRS